MWLLSKTGAIAVAAYLLGLFAAGMVVQHYVKDPIAIPIWGALLSLPGSIIVGNPGHAYYAIAFNAIILYLLVAVLAARRKK